jgi:UDP-N-acetylmuramate dehydrogenase
MEIKTVSMKEYSSLRVGGEGKVVEAATVSELKEALLHAKSEGFRVHILGQGTNSYFGNNLSEFLFIKLNIKGITLEQESQTAGYRLQAFASEIWDDVVLFAVEKGLRGIENLSYIPGTFGAAPVQNIGAYGVELADTFVSCEVFDTHNTSVKTLSKNECHFAYRDSIFKHEIGRYIILSATLLLSENKAFTLTYKPLDELSSNQGLSVKDVREKVIEVRRVKLPEWKEHPNCGSFFKNPVVSKEQGEALRTAFDGVPLIEVENGYKVPAAWLIDNVAKMKGLKIGNLRTWDKQPLVLVNDGEASADDVDAFSKTITKAIFDKTGIQMEQEVNRVGRGAKTS